MPTAAYVGFGLMAWAAAAGVSLAGTPELAGDFVLAPMQVGALENAALPGTIDNDRGIYLGGFSDLWRGEHDRPGEFWIVTDRGPNGALNVDGTKRRTFPVPRYVPLLLHIAVDGRRLTVRDSIPLVGRSGKALNGLPNDPQADGPPYDFRGQRQLDCNANGLDTEGLVRTPDGAFWLAEEYRPSLAKVDAAGRVLARFVPAGTKLAGADYEVLEALPAIYARRQDNRGFEGLAISPDGKTIYAPLQSALANPTEKVGKQSRNTRILAFDVVAQRPAAEYVYQFDVAEQFEPGAKTGDMKIGAVAIVAAGQMLALEQGDRVAKVYAVDLSAATNVLDSSVGTATDDKSLEAIDDLPAAGIRPLPKKLVVDLSQIAGLPGKLEGMCIVDRHTLAFVNDNDFGFDGFDVEGNALRSGVKTRLLLVRLPRPVDD